MLRVNLTDDAWRECGGVYGIHNKESNKWYVGSVVFQVYDGSKRNRNIHVRLNEHVREARKGRHHNKYFQRAWDKHGESAFEFYVLEAMTETPSDVDTKAVGALYTDREQYFLDMYKAADPEFGYNANPTADSSLGRRRSQETIDKLKQVNSVRTPARQAASKKWIDLMVSRHKGRKRDPDAVRKTTDALRLNFNDVKQSFTDNGCELLVTTYVNARTPMEYRCVCGKISKITWDSFRSGRRCRECGYGKVREKLLNNHNNRYSVAC